MMMGRWCFCVVERRRWSGDAFRGFGRAGDGFWLLIKDVWEIGGVWKSFS